jgi:hypothetical protein
MMDQIKSLKIIAYEKTLAAQQAQLQYLQIQIRPHFFLNCLSALYGLAEVGESEKNAANDPAAVPLPEDGSRAEPGLGPLVQRDEPYAGLCVDLPNEPGDADIAG